MILAIIFFPLIASIITGLCNKILSIKIASIICTTSVVISALISAFVFYRVGICGEVIHIKIIEWLNVGGIHADFAMYIDQLTSIMLITVTFISSAVHIYSVGYMCDDENVPRFMSFLSLFTTFMLLLVTSDNFLQLFFGWEGVGLCSYLLIGFWYKKDSANFASIKAFVVNRVGDLAFIVGIIFIYSYFGSLEFAYIFGKVPALAEQKTQVFGHNFYVIEIICFLLFIGCMGKSAQIGLHVWLPDAMEGPTPVSALIHAATMVTAGIFLLARCSYLFEYAASILGFIIIIGSITCLFSAVIAITQNDIKRIIAYSTCSQLGYMFLACGLSTYEAGIFHLYTHAYFKAALFLAAGSVIHATHEQDITKIGGLRKFMPITYVLFWIGSLAIMGIFPFSGYFSKDLILSSAYLSGTFAGDFAYKCGIMAAFCTAIYSVKIIVKVFHGKQSEKIHHIPKESPIIMNVPLIFLAAGSIFAGLIGKNILDITTPITGFFKASVFTKEFKLGSHTPFSVEIMPTIVAITGMLIGYIAFSTNISSTISKLFRPLYKLITNKFYFDEIYNYIFIKQNDQLSQKMNFIDNKVIDFCGPVIVTIISYNSAKKISSIHNGLINFYAFTIAIGTVASLSILVYKYVL